MLLLLREEGDDTGRRDNQHQEDHIETGTGSLNLKERDVEANQRPAQQDQEAGEEPDRVEADRETSGMPAPLLRCA